MQGEFRSGFFRTFCASIVVLACGCLTLAQAPPDEAHAFAMGPTDVGVEFTACRTSDAANCYLDFSIYRNPPGFSQAPVWYGSINADQASHTIYDLKVQAGQTFCYQVCAGGFANGSNCIQTNCVKTPVASSPAPTPTPKSNDPVLNNGPSSFRPPTNLQAMFGGSAAYLKWNNPNPRDDLATEITVYRGTTSPDFLQFLKLLTWRDSSYTDPGPFMPHTGYHYAVCEGYPATPWNNCETSKPIVTWGADPILTVTRTGSSTAHLSLVVDNYFDLASITITRQGSDDPCRQGGNLGNGQQGCRTQSVGPNGVLVNGPNNVTVFQRTSQFPTHSPSAPWIIDIPDDSGLKPQVEYYYIAHVTWLGTGQDSAVVTVPSEFSRAPAPVRGFSSGGPKPITPPSGRPAPAGRAIAPSRAGMMPAGAVNLDSAINNVKAKPGDAQALYALGQAYCASRLKSPCVSFMYMGFLQAEKAGNAQLASEIRNSLAQRGVTVQ